MRQRRRKSAEADKLSTVTPDSTATVKGSDTLPTANRINY